MTLATMPYPCKGCGRLRFVKQVPKSDFCLSCARKVKRLQRSCKTCGKTIELRECDLRRPGRGQFCSPSCWYVALGERQSRQRRGSGNPSFRTGRYVDPQRARRGWGLKEKGEATCRVCGSSEWVQLHHAIPRSKCRAARDDLRNGLPLCASCHQRWHKHSLAIHRDVFTSEEWSYLSSVKLTGEMIGPWLDKHYPAREVAV